LTLLLTDFKGSQGPGGPLGSGRLKKHHSIMQRLPSAIHDSHFEVSGIAPAGEPDGKRRQPAQQGGTVGHQDLSST
jgi:hypothetical protein